MSQARGTAGGALALLGLALAAGCAGPEPNMDDPASVAAHLFVLAASEPDEETLASFFDPALAAKLDVPLLDALDAVPRSESPDLLGVESAPGAEEAFVDLSVDLPGDGRAAYSVKLLRLGEEGWRITWFQGPGVEWPPRGGQGASLTTSAPPEPAAGGW